MSIRNSVLQWALSQFSTKEPLQTEVQKSLRLALGLPHGPGAPLQLSEKPLTSVFSELMLDPAGQKRDLTETMLPMASLEPTAIAYPITGSTVAPTVPRPDEFRQAAESDNLALVFLERHASFRAISDDERARHISFYDAVKIGAAIQTCLEQRDNDNPFLLVSADFSGIQNFVYTISSKGALKTLRARSFMLEMLAEHVIYEILGMTGAERYHIVFSGGGGFTLLLPNTSDTKDRIQAFKQTTNEWLLRIAGGKLYLALQAVPCSEETLTSNLLNLWQDTSNGLDDDKKQKFVELMDTELFAIKDPQQPANNPDAEPRFRECEICHRDDVEVATEGEMRCLDGDSTIACPMCYCLLHLGDDLTESDYRVYRLSTEQREGIPNNKGILEFLSHDRNDVFYLVSSDNLNDYEAKWVKNSWDLALYNEATYPLMIANYVRKHNDLSQKAQAREPEAESIHTATFEGLATSACGADLLGALRMDVDNLGLIFSQGVGEKFNLATLSTLSRYLNLFFKVYLNRICGGELDIANEQPLDIVGKDYANNGGRNVSIIYSGGDDLFIVGAWDEVTELAYDIHRCFKKFTSGNPDLGISGGVTLHQPNFPLYQIARLSGEAELEAKSNHDANPAHKYRKESIAVFYNRYFKERQRQIAKRVMQMREDETIDLDDSGERLLLRMKWGEFQGFVLSVLAWFEPFLDTTNKERLRFQKDFPGGFTFKLLALVDGWYEEGRLFLPHLLWLVQKSNAVFQQVARPLEKQTTLIRMFDEDKLKHLHIPITWIEYLQRGGTSL